MAQTTAEQGLENLLAKLHGVRRSGSSYSAKCPAHDDGRASLSVKLDSDKILVHCHAGCTPENICAAVGLSLSDLFTKSTNGRRPSRKAAKIIAMYDYVNQGGELLYQVVRYEPKDFRQRRPDGHGGWIWELGDVRRVLYRLPGVLAATDILVVEGEKDVETARALRFVATCNPGGAGKWKPEHSEALRGKRVAVIADADEPGRKHAHDVVTSLSGKAESVKLLELPGAKDLTEWVQSGGQRDALLGLIQAASEWKPETIDGAMLLDKVESFVRRFVVLLEAQARVITLWIAHTHAVGAATATPYLAITSAEKQSGKTRTLEVLETLVANPWLTARCTAAVLVRKIDKEHPSLLLDESDAAFAGEKEYAEALRAVLNSGYRASGKASCCVGQGANLESRDFSTYCAKAIAGIGVLPDTVADRSLPIRLKRALPSERVDKFRTRTIEPEAAHLRDALEKWASSVLEILAVATPQIPETLTDRQQDVVEPLLAIADAAGGDWPLAARVSVMELCAESRATDGSIGARLLADIRSIFTSRGVDRISSSDLADALADIETSPWGEWSKGKPLSPAKLARLLHPFGVAPNTVRVGEKTPKGYLLEDFRDVFERYLGPENTPAPAHLHFQSATTPQANTGAGSSEFSKRNTLSGVALQKPRIR